MGPVLAFSEILGQAQIFSPFVQYSRVFVAAASRSHTNISIVPTYGVKAFPTIALASELLRTLPQLKLKPTKESWIRLIPKQEARNCQMSVVAPHTNVLCMFIVTQYIPTCNSKTSLHTPSTE